MATQSFFGYMATPKIKVDPIWEVITDFVSTSRTGIFTFPISPAIDFNDNSMVVIEMEIISSSGTGNQLVLEINGVGFGYSSIGRTIKAGVETIVNLTGQNNFRLANLSLFTNPLDTAHIIVYLQLNKRIGIQSFANGVNQNANMNMSGDLSNNQTELNQIKLLIFSVGMEAGSRVTIYKVKRK